LRQHGVAVTIAEQDQLGDAVGNRKPGIVGIGHRARHALRLAIRPPGGRMRERSHRAAGHVAEIAGGPERDILDRPAAIDERREDGQHGLDAFADDEPRRRIDQRDGDIGAGL